MPLNDIKHPHNLPQAKTKPQNQQIKFDNKENKKAFFQNRKSREPSPDDKQFKEFEKKNKKNQKGKKKGTVAKPKELKKPAKKQPKLDESEFKIIGDDDSDHSIGGMQVKFSKNPTPP